VMLDLIEKISTGICIVVVLSVAGMYAVFGTGSSTPIEAVPKVVFQDVTSASAAPAPRPSTPGAAPAPAPSGPQVDERAIADLLRKQGVAPRGALQARKARVPSNTFEYVQHEANWMKELKVYRSVVLPNPSRQGTRLQLAGGVEDNTLLGKLGFENGDVIELIDERMIDFSEGSSLQFRSLAKDAIEKLRKGDSISVTVTRDRQPVHLMFSLR